MAGLDASIYIYIYIFIYSFIFVYREARKPGIGKGRVRAPALVAADGGNRLPRYVDYVCDRHGYTNGIEHLAWSAWASRNSYKSHKGFVHPFVIDG